MLGMYPKNTLIDIYKSSFQDAFGPEHLVEDRNSVLHIIWIRRLLNPMNLPILITNFAEQRAILSEFICP